MRVLLTSLLVALLLASAGAQQPSTVPGQRPIPTPEQFFGFRMGTDNKLARWDKIVDYMKQVSGQTDRIRFRELGKSTNGNPFIALEITSPDTLKNLDTYKQLQRKLYFQGGAAPRPDPRHVSDAVQRAVPGDERSGEARFLVEAP